VVLPDLRENGAPVTFDARTWKLHDGLMQLARESGLDAFRVVCKRGPEGETIIALVVGEKSAGAAKKSRS
jgi:hypothetical protein